MMFEKQCKSGIDKLKASPFALDKTSLTDSISDSPAKSEPGTSPVEHNETGCNPVDVVATASEEESKKLGDKQKALEKEPLGNLDREVDLSDSQPSKRAKVNE